MKIPTNIQWKIIIWTFLGILIAFVATKVMFQPYFYYIFGSMGIGWGALSMFKQWAEDDSDEADIVVKVKVVDDSCGEVCLYPIIKIGMKILVSTVVGSLITPFAILYGLWLLLNNLYQSIQSQSEQSSQTKDDVSDSN